MTLKTQGALVKGSLELRFEERGDRLHGEASLTIRIPIKGELKYSLRTEDLLLSNGEISFQSMLMRDFRKGRDHLWERTTGEKMLSPLGALVAVARGSREPMAITVGEKNYFIRVVESGGGLDVFSRKHDGPEKKQGKIVLAHDELESISVSVPAFGQINFVR